MSSRDITLAITSIVNAGIELPASLIAARDKAQRRVTRILTTGEAEAAVAAAETPEEFDQAVYELHRAMTYSGVRLDAVQARVAAVHERLLADAFHPVADDLLAEITRRYNDEAPAFAEAVNRIPDLTGRDVTDLSIDAAQALADAQTTVEPLHRLWTAYQATTKVLGYKTETGKTGPSASRIVAAIGTGMDDDQHHQAVSLVNGYVLGDAGLRLKRFAPHVAVVRAGGTLELVSPDEARSRLNELPDSPRGTGYSVSHYAQM